MLRFSTNTKWWNFGLLTFTLFDSPCRAAIVYTVDVFQCIGDTCCCSQEHICHHSSSDTVRTGMGLPVGGLWETTSRTQRCLVLQLHKTRWNRLMENSSRSCLSRNNTLRAFVSNPLWSVRVEAKRLDHMTRTRSVPSGSSSTARYLTRARPEPDPRPQHDSEISKCLLLFLHEAPFTLCLMTHELFMARLPNGWILAVQ